MHQYGPTQCETNLVTYPRVGKNIRELIQLISFSTKTNKSRGETYAIAVCDIRPQKTETDRTRLTTGGNFMDYPVEVSTPKSDLTTMKLHLNSAISDVKSRYMCMDVKSLPYQPDGQGRIYHNSDFNDTTEICEQI